MPRDSFTEGYAEGAKAAQGDAPVRAYCPVEITDHHEPLSVLRYREGFNAGLLGVVPLRGVHD